MKKFNEIDLLARTAWGEARSEGAQGMQAVINVVINRAGSGRWFGGAITEVITKDYQFSAWNKNDPNRAAMLAVDTSDPAFVIALALAKQAVLGTLPDVTGGATHYKTRQASAMWADERKLVREIGNHQFYAGIA